MDSDLKAHDSTQRTRTGSESRLLASILDATRAHPTDRKILIGPDVNWGRELLLAAARRTGGWIGWEATNLREVANELAQVPLAERGFRVAGDIELSATVGQAIDEAAAEGKLSAGAVALVSSLGFRTALTDAVFELRTSGVAPALLLEHAARGTPAHDLGVVAQRYELAIDAARVADPAAVFRVAIECFEREAPFALGGLVYLAPTLFLRGLPRQLAAKLLAAGAAPLEGDAPAALEEPASLPERRAVARTPDVRSPLAWCGGAVFPEGEQLLDGTSVQVDFLAAATPSDELREVLRRAVSEGWRLDQVEIVSTDPDTYGIALDALSQRTEIGCTMLAGIPLARTRLGRALERWLSWLGNGLPADTLRHAIEAGELRAPVEEEEQVGPSRLSGELRRLQVGWGRVRYAAALGALRAGADEPIRQYDEESEEDYASRVAGRRRAAAALAALLDAILVCTPIVPERGSNAPVKSSAAKLAQSLLGWLTLVPVHGEAEQNTASRLRSRLEAIAAIEEPDTAFGAALAALRSHLADLRAWPLVTHDRKPWSAAPGMPHLTDLAHAGTTGRPRVFVVGLDGDRTSAGHGQDPFLNDALRARLGDGLLATTGLRQRERSWLVAQALAGLRGRVTLSYSTRGSLDGRDASPAAELLQAWRIISGNATLGYRDLRKALTPPACAVPAVPREAIDARDAWLAALADGPILLDGSEAVLDAFPGIARGLEAQRQAAAPDANGYHGLIVVDPPEVGGNGRRVSPSSLELLAKCPMAWLYRYGMGLRAPQDPEYDPDAWLDAAQRGSLLHKVYERFCGEWVKRQDDLHLPEARESILAVTRDVIAEWEREVPPPSDEVRDAEAAALEVEALVFLEMERAREKDPLRGRWQSFERSFGEGENAEWAAGSHRLPVTGKIDRVDVLPDGTRRVVDYKTGSVWAYRHDPKQGPFRGGRTLQAALYSRIIERLDGTRVSHFEYRFPTQKGEHEIVRYGPEELDEGERIVQRVLDMADAGHFVPTTDTSDCKFCDYRPICRVTQDNFGNARCGRVSWAAQASERGLDVYAIMRGHRTAGGAA